MTAIIDLGPPPFIGEEGENTWFNVYPNPASERLYIRAGFEFDMLEILNMNGQLVLSTSEIPENGIDISELKPGNYILRITNEKLQYCKVLVID